MDPISQVQRPWPGSNIEAAFFDLICRHHGLQRVGQCFSGPVESVGGKPKGTLKFEIVVMRWMEVENRNF